MQDQKLSEIEEKIEKVKQETHVTQCTTRRSLAHLCEFLESYEDKAETESEQEEQELAVAVEPALS